MDQRSLNKKVWVVSVEGKFVQLKGKVRHPLCPTYCANEKSAKNLASMIFVGHHFIATIHKVTMGWLLDLANGVKTAPLQVFEVTSIMDL